MGPVKKYLGRKNHSWWLLVALAPPRLPIESIKLAPVKCGLLSTSVLSSAQLLRLQPSCGEDFIRQESFFARRKPRIILDESWF
jgi:hypothetical protein